MKYFLLLALWAGASRVAAALDITGLALVPGSPTAIPARPDQVAGTVDDTATSLGTAADWEVIFRDAAGNLGRPVKPVRITGRFLLDLPVSSVPAGWTQMLVRFSSPSGPILAVRDARQGFLSGPTAPARPLFGPYVEADAKEESDIYLSGIYSPRINSDPLYTIDVSAGYMRYVTKSKPFRGRWGGVASVKTDERKTLDADSYYAGLAYQAYLRERPLWKLQGIIFHWNALGTEFNRNGGENELGETVEGRTYGVVSAPTLEFPLVLLPRPNTSDKTILTLRHVVGYELGSNLSNALTDAGSGLLSRGLLGTDLKLTAKPGWPGLHKLTLSSSYRVRLLGRPELFTITRKSAVTDKDFDDFSTGTQPRHSVESGLAWFLFPGVGFSVKHEYGSLPPLFRLVEHKVTFEFTAMLRQKDSSRSAIRRR